MASLLDRPAFGPYMQNIGANRAYEPSALAIIAFVVTWACMGLIQIFGRGRRGVPPPTEGQGDGLSRLEERAEGLRGPTPWSGTSILRSRGASSSRSSGPPVAARPRRSA